MFTSRPFQLAGCILFTVSTPSFAQITPEELWQSWQGMSSGMGYSLTATPSRQGDTLTLDNAMGTIASGPTTFTAPMGRIVMRDRGDGSVEVTMPPAYSMQMAINEPGRDPVDMRLDVVQAGLSMIVSGTPSDQRYAYQAQELGVALAEIAVKGTPVSMTMDVSLNDVSGNAGIRFAGPMRTEYSIKADGMSLVVGADNPQGDGSTEMTAEVSRLEINFDGTLPTNLTANAQLPAMLAAGLNGTGSYRTGSIEASVFIDNKGEEVTAEGTVDETSTDFTLTAGGIGYQASARGIDMTVAGGQIPFPDLRIKLAEQTLGLTMPLVKTDSPSDYALLLRLVDLVLPPSVWGMLDPMGQLPHDPATVVVDAKGKATLFMDLGTPEAAQPGAVPGQFESVQVDALQLRAAGADLTGTGAFTFDNTDKQTFPGMPRPAGTVDLKLVGGNALLDKLVAMGLVPQDQVMGFRMMLALFARPGDGPDTLTSRIEVTPEGAILANGQRIQ